MPYPLRVTSTTLSDGRELLYFDDEPEYVSGAATRELRDSRDLPIAHTHSEMRRDPLTGEWNVYAAHRMNRTFMPPANENPLAPTRPGELPTEIPAEDYDVVVFENRFPSLSVHMDVPADFAEYADDIAFSDSAAAPADGLVPRRPALARCEVVCFTPDATSSFKDLPVERVRTVIEVWAHRTAALSAIPGVQLVFPFENRGAEIGVTLQHPHGQIYSYPFLPTRARQIRDRARDFRQAHGADLFDAVYDMELRGDRVIEGGEHFLVFVPAAAKWPVEAMILPRRAVADFTELRDEEKDELAVLYRRLLAAIDRYFEGVDKTPYIAAWNQAPVGEDRPFGRLHLQLFSLMRSPDKMKFLAGSESGQGAWISDTTPERIAARFREVWE